MSLIKWGGGVDDRKALVLRARNLLAVNKEPVGKKETVQADLARRAGAPFPSLPAASVVTNARPVLHVPRWCSVLDELGIAIYNWNGGGYGFTGSYALTRQYQSQYRPENLIALPDDFEPDSEQCGCCGMWTPRGKAGAVWCPRCRAFVCYGNTSPSGYFVCRASCGFEGQCTLQRHPEMGFVMGRAGRNF